MFKIRITYNTGDSFHTETREEEVEGVWEDIHVVAENLERIKQHWQYYVQEETLYFGNKIKKPSFVEKDKEYGVITLYFKTDEGKEYKYLPFWIGYFEKLQKAEVCVDLVYEPN